MENNPRSNRIRSFIRRHMLEAAIVSFGIVLAITLWNMNELRLQIHQSTAIETASAYMDAYEGVRKVYANEVIPGALKKGVRVTHDYRSYHDAIPLPATFAMAWAKEIGSTGRGVTARLYSDFPFPWNKDGGTRDVFGRSAISYFRNHPDEAYYNFESDDLGWRLRYARADRMRESCVACHNSHPDSPKRDWKVGDVRGVLEVTIPMSVANFAGVKIMRERIFLVVILGGFFFALFYWFLVWVFSKEDTKP